MASTGALVLALAGCGLGAGPGNSRVTLTITRDFGHSTVAEIERPSVPGAETVMRLLERSVAVRTRSGGGSVQSIDGLAGDSRHHEWFYYVNGIEAPRGAAVTPVHSGDRVWWDLHDWSAAESIPAVVGSFPEPFVHGSQGKRLPTTLECAADVALACQTVGNELERLGVAVAVQLPGTGSGTDSLTVVVGTWRDLRGEIVARLIEQGPSSSGVYARFAANGQALALLDPAGGLVRTLSRQAGLVAATAHGSSSPPTWLITGTDAAGVTLAARALTPSRLHDRFALAVTGSGDLSLPRPGGS